MVCYAGKQEKPFWFSSLDQKVQFAAIMFCKTFENYFGQFVWIGKKKSHYVSCVSLHEAPTKKLICDRTDKRKYLIHYRMLKFYVRHGMIVEKFQEVISLNRVSG